MRHIDNLPSNSKMIAPSKIKAEGKIFTDTKGMQEHSIPELLSTEEVYQVIEEYVQASKNAMKAGFDVRCRGFVIRDFNFHILKL